MNESKQNEPQNPGNKEVPNILGKVVDLPLATTEITTFRENILNLPDYPENASKTKACHVRRIDLEKMLNERPDIDGIRCYLGMRTETVGPLSGQYVTCLVMVGTYLEDGIYVDNLGPDNNLIYEFTTPCPDTCDPSSPLNNC